MLFHDVCIWIQILLELKWHETLSIHKWVDNFILEVYLTSKRWGWRKLMNYQMLSFNVSRQTHLIKRTGFNILKEKQWNWVICFTWNPSIQPCNFPIQMDAYKAHVRPKMCVWHDNQELIWTKLECACCGRHVSSDKHLVFVWLVSSQCEYL